MKQQPGAVKRLIHHFLALDCHDQTVQAEAIAVSCPHLPQAFHLARVAVVTDLHLPDQLVSIPRLARSVALQRPDAIFLVGDLTNSYAVFDGEGLRRLATALAAIAPCFAVPGNHEWRLGREPEYRRILTECGVQYLCDSYADWHKDGATLRLFGVGEQPPAPLDVADQPTIVLAHRPEHFRDYCNAGWDIVICGHAHGGHVRMRDGSLFSPDQGFLPTYTHGVYEYGGTRMVVSRGLGNSSIPWRVNNPPHLPMLILSAKDA